jgi:hypothetical protein
MWCSTRSKEQIKMKKEQDSEVAAYYAAIEQQIEFASRTQHADKSEGVFLGHTNIVLALK